MKLYEAYQNIQGVRENPNSSDAELKCAYEVFMKRVIIEGKEGILNLHKTNKDFRDRCEFISRYEFELANPEDIIMMCYLRFHH